MDETIETVKPGEGSSSSTPIENVETKTETPAFDLDNVGPVENTSVDLDKFDKTKTVIAKAEVSVVPSQYCEIGRQWVLKVESEVLETVEKKESDGTTRKIEFRASELFNLVQDDAGKLVGFPTGESSNLMQFAKDLGIKDADKLGSLKSLITNMIGREVLIKAHLVKKGEAERTYLKFRY